MDEYLFITLAKLRFDARLEARKAADEASATVRPQYQLDEAASRTTLPRRPSPKARWFVPGSHYGEQS